MRKWILVCLMMISPNLFAETIESTNTPFNKIFLEWTKAFNSKDLKKSCDLFSSQVIADYQGIPQKNYDAICNGFKKIFQETHRRYEYRYVLHEVYHSGNLGVARMTWYLRIYEKNKLISTTQDEGLDVFLKDKSGAWKIISYLGYPVHSQA